MKPATTYLLATGLAAASVLFLVLAIGALGIIGDGGRPDRVYAAVLAVALVGTVLARLRPGGMARTLLAMALTQVLATAAAFAAGVPDDASVADVLGINAMYVALYCLAAWLYRRAAEQRSAVPVGGRG